jgi:hypothetical protein
METIATSNTIQLSSILRAQYGAGRVTLPTQGNGVYARFEHVVGIPDTRGQGGFSLSRLRMVNQMIERLVKLGEATGVTPVQYQDATTEGSELDFGAFAARLHDLIQKAEQTSMSRLPGTGAAEPGGLFSLSA